jgi:ABC-type lipoprotein export system ATPase subunit
LYQFDHDTDVELLRGLSFSVSRDTSLAVIGPHGSGQTRILNRLARLNELQCHGAPIRPPIHRRALNRYTRTADVRKSSVFS